MGMLQLAQSCGFSVGILMWGCALTVYLPPHLVLGLCCGGWGLSTALLACVQRDQLGLALSLRFGCGYSISGLLPGSWRQGGQRSAARRERGRGAAAGRRSKG